MEIKLSQKESEEYFYTTLCNHSAIDTYGFEFTYDVEDYRKAKISLLENMKRDELKDTICREDVLMEILKNGGKLYLTDKEGNGEYTKGITIDEVHERVQLAPKNHLFNMILEHADSTSASVILQTVFYGEVLFS